MTYSYNELERDLRVGHEIEFRYKKDKYSISHNSKGWYLTQFNSSNYQTFDNYQELMRIATINNIRLEEIWDDVIVEIVF